MELFVYNYFFKNFVHLIIILLNTIVPSNITFSKNIFYIIKVNLFVFFILFVYSKCICINLKQNYGKI